MIGALILTVNPSSKSHSRSSYCLQALVRLHKHANVIRLLNVILEKGSLYLVFEYAERSLLDLITSALQSESTLSEAQIRLYRYYLLLRRHYHHLYFFLAINFFKVYITSTKTVGSIAISSRRTSSSLRILAKSLTLGFHAS